MSSDQSSQDKEPLSFHGAFSIEWQEVRSENKGDGETLEKVAALLLHSGSCHQSFQVCSISVWLEGSFKGPQFTFLCDVVGRIRVAKVAADLIISSQGQKISK